MKLKELSILLVDRGAEHKGVYLFFLIGLTASLVLLTFQKVMVYDTWWHLASGKYIVEHLSVPKTDPFAFTTEGLRWVDVAWLYQVILYGMYRLFGYGGVVALKVITLFSAFGVTFFSMRRITSERLLPIAVLWCIAIAVSFRFTCRPHTFAYLLFALSWLCLIRFCENPSWKWVSAAGFVTLLWANTHGSFILAPLLFSLPIAKECIASRKEQVRDLISRRSFRIKAALFVASVIATFITPHGLELYFQVFPRESEAVQEAMRHIQEWRRISPLYFFTFGWEKSLFFKIFFWSVVLLLVIRMREGVEVSLLLWAIFAGVMTYLLLKYYRFVSFASFGLAPLCALLVEGRLLLDGKSRDRRKIPERPVKIASLATIILCSLFMLGQIRAGAFPAEDMGFGVKWDRYPLGLVKLVKEKGLSGNMLNTYGWGGFLIWQLYPEHKVFIDGRLNNVYDPELFWLLIAAEAGKKGALKELVERWKIEFAIIESPVLCRMLEKDFRFRVVGFDHLGFLLVSERSLPKGLQPFTEFDPCDNGRQQISKAGEQGGERLKKVESEILRAIREVPSYRAYELAGMLYAEGYKDYERAYDHYAKALQIAGESGGVSLLFNTASMAFELGRYDEALRLLRRLLRRDDSRPEAWLLMAKTLYHKGKYGEALKAIRRHLILVGDIGTAEAYMYLGMIQNELYEPGKAAEAFNRAVVTAASDDELKRAYYNLGRCYQVLNEVPKAEECFRKALEIDRGFREAEEALREVKGESL